MKTAAIFIGLFCACVAAEDAEDCPLMKALKKSFADCSESLQPSEETLKSVAEGKDGDKDEVKCFHSCMMEKAGLMENAKVNFEKMEDLLKSGEKPDEDKINAVMGMFKECRDEAEVTDNSCEVAGSYSKCFQEKKKSMEEKNKN